VDWDIWCVSQQDNWNSFNSIVVYHEGESASPWWYYWASQGETALQGWIGSEWFDHLCIPQPPLLQWRQCPDLLFLRRGDEKHPVCVIPEAIPEALGWTIGANLIA
jgi:hypothetical protein